MSWLGLERVLAQDDLISSRIYRIRQPRSIRARGANALTSSLSSL